MCDDKCCDPSKNPRTVTNDARAAAAQLQKFAKINYGVWSGVQQTLTTRAPNGFHNHGEGSYCGLLLVERQQNMDTNEKIRRDGRVG